MNTDRRHVLQLLAAAGAALPLLATAQQRRVRLRGKIEELRPGKLVLRERSGERIELALAPDYGVTEVYPVTLADVKPGTFVGVGAMPQADGTQRAIARR
jgi:hypothetical protein